MTATRKQIELIIRLAERTAKGELDWQPTEDDGAFQVAFSNASVRIRTAFDPESEAEDIVVDIYNDQGSLVDTITDPMLFKSGVETPVGNRRWYPFMQAFYASARRTALGSDRVVDAILKEIDNK